MPWVTRYIPLAGGGTAFDPDPAITQPGETALDGAAQPIAVHTVFRGVTWGDLQVVNDAGEFQPVGAELFDFKFVKRTLSDSLPAAGTSRPRFAWNSGDEVSATAPGVEVSQTGMEAPVAVTLVVTGGTTAPATGRLAVRMWIP